MIRIGIHNKKEFDSESLLNEILSQCQTQKNNNKALAFAFIIYDFKDAEVRKVLRDNDYWDALNEISGNKLGIFHLDASVSLNGHLPNININREYVQTINTKIRQLLNIEDSIKTPYIIFFQVDNDGKILDSYLISLKEDDINKSFLEQKKLIQAAVDSIIDVKDENRNENQAIFNLIKNTIPKSGYSIFNIKLSKISEYITIGSFLSQLF